MYRNSAVIAQHRQSEEANYEEQNCLGSTIFGYQSFLKAHWSSLFSPEGDEPLIFEAVMRRWMKANESLSSMTGETRKLPATQWSFGGNGVQEWVRGGYESPAHPRTWLTAFKFVFSSLDIVKSFATPKRSNDDRFIYAFILPWLRIKRQNPGCCFIIYLLL